jgi:predicted acetyltransferase
VSALTLEGPSVERIDSYRALVREFLVRGEPGIPFVLDWPSADAAAFVERCAASARGEGLPEGFVPHSTFWIVEDGREVVGVSNLRHRLTESLRIEGGHIGYGVRPSARKRGVATELLRQTLGRARADHAIDEALVTCAATNEASIRTILRNGGRYDGETYVEKRGEVVRRYWVATTATSSWPLPGAPLPASP